MDDNKIEKQNYSKKNMANHDGIAGFMYICTVIGAAIYFIQSVSGFWAGVLGFLKAWVWPVFAIQKVLELLKL
jgi:hypothetical protein